MANISTTEREGEIQRDQFVRCLRRTDRVAFGRFVGDCDWTASDRRPLWMAQICMASPDVRLFDLHDRARVDIASCRTVRRRVARQASHSGHSDSDNVGRPRPRGAAEHGDVEGLYGGALDPG